MVFIALQAFDNYLSPFGLVHLLVKYAIFLNFHYCTVVIEASSLFILEDFISAN